MGGDYFPESHFRVLGIYSDDVQGISRCFVLLVEKLVECGNDERDHAPQPGAELLGKEHNKYIFRLCVSKTTSSAMIGPGGASIKQLRRETGAKVFVENDTKLGHQMVRIIGTPETIVKGLDRVNEYVQVEAGTEGYLAWAQLINFGEQEGNAPSIEHNSTPHSGDARRGSFVGGDAPRVIQASQAVRERVSLLSEALESLPPDTASLHYSVTCKLAASRVGALVGKSGEYIKHVERATNSSVDFAPIREEPNTMQTMSVVGPLPHIYAAHLMMIKKYKDVEIREHEAGRRRQQEEGWHQQGGTSEETMLRTKIEELQSQLAEVRGGKGKGGSSRD